MGLSAIKQAFYPEEFVVDEKPLEITVPDKDAESTNEKSPVAEEAMAALDAVFGRSNGGTDLLSQTTQLLLEQVRLAEMAKLAEAGRARDDEFSRFVRQALPFLDNFSHLLELAREHPPSHELDAWLKNTEALYFRITRLFEGFGLRFINSVGKTVDLDYHEVVEYRSTTEFPHNTIIKELQKGVVFRGRLIRDARVVVARNPGAE
ncbi:MAG: nucleotide exchange factor GrpE [bacterium]|nr:nucleotide exchange factor GrpE [bacterium]